MEELIQQSTTTHQNLLKTNFIPIILSRYKPAKLQKKNQRESSVLLE